MVVNINNYVDVSITLATRSIQKANFGTLLVVGDSGKGTAGQIDSYQALSDVAAVYASTDAEYKAASAFFGQTPHPTTLKIGEQDTKVAQVQTLTFDVEFVNLNVIDMDVDGVGIATVTYAVSHDNTMALVATAIQAMAGVVTAVVTGGAGSKVITVTSAVAGVPTVIDSIVVTLGAAQAVGVMATTVDNHGMTEDLTTLLQFDPEWYGLVTTSKTEAEVLQAAAWTQSNEKLYGTSSNDADIYDAAATTDIAYQLEALEYTRTFGMYYQTAAVYPEAAWFAQGFVKDPGTQTWMFKPLTGFTANSLTANQRIAVLAKRFNVYSDAGESITEDGRVVSGDFIDNIRAADYIKNEMQTEVLTQLLNVDKIPFTNAGIATIENIVRGILNSAIEDDIIAPDPDSYDGSAYYVSFPDVSDVSTADKGNRYLPDGEFQATFAGAIHKVQIRGYVRI